MDIIIPLYDLQKIAEANGSRVAVSPLAGSPSLIQTSTGQQMLRPRPANAAGISINQFDSFDVSGGPLKILNIADDVGDAAIPKLIIVVANNIVLNNEIEVIGPATDILFLSTASNGTIACNYCKFSNVSRVTMAVANPASVITDDSTFIGQLDSSPNGRITVNSLLAPGTVHLELLADQQEFQSVISTNTRVSQDSNGGYSENAFGQYSMGSGGINVLHGRMSWSYEDQKILRVYPQGETNNVIGGTFNAAAVKITSSEGLWMVADIDTRNDLLSSVRYRGENFVTSEAITIQTFGTFGQILNGKYYTDNEMSISTSAAMLLSSNAHIEARHAKLVAADGILNLGFLNADHLEIGAKYLTNRSHLESRDALEIWAQKNVVNEFGGEIVADIVNIQSDEGLVRNGSRTPYIPNDTEVSELLHYQPSDLHPWNIGIYGTFYHSGMQVTTDTERTRAEKTHAHILGNQVRIKAFGVENINPYWETSAENAEIELDREYGNQVTLSGENEITVDATNYILNSSAIIRLNSPSGNLPLKGSMVTNERYRTMSALDKVYVTTTNTYSTTSSSTTTESYVQRLYATSPPGIVVSMGNLLMEASTGFLNNMSYLEVFGNAQFKTSNISDIGFEQSGIRSKKSSGTYVTKCPEWQNVGVGRGAVKKKIYVDCVKDYSNSTIRLLTSKKMDSLFYVYGALDGVNVNFTPVDYDPFDFTKYIAVLDVIDSYVHSDGRKIGDSTVISAAQKGEVEFALAASAYAGTPININPQTPYYWSTNLTAGHRIEGDTIYLDVKETTGLADSTGNIVWTTTESVKTYAYSLFEYVKKIYENSWVYINALLNEIDWWN